MNSSSTLAFADYAQEVRPEIDAALLRWSEYDQDCPAELREAIQYSLLAPGKRLRPLLVLMAAEACGGARSEAMPAACSVEMIHAYSLIHDDLPAMDDDDLRRGRPSCHAQFGEALAILAGDALLARAFELLAREIRPPERAARCCAELGWAAGASALVGGQCDDLAAERGTRPGGLTGLPALERIHTRKTGALIRVSLRLGAITAGATPVDQERLDRYGLCLGTAFQIVDDLLDHEGNEADLGKRTGKDLDRGKLTFPGVLGVEESRRRAAKLIEQGCAELTSFGEEGGRLVDLARFVIERRG